MRKSLRQLQEATHARYVWYVRLCACSFHLFRPPVKFFTSLGWQAKFTAVAQQFLEHKGALRDDLQIHTSMGLTVANVTLSTISEDLKKLDENLGGVMALIFERMRSSEEREVASFILSQPGGIEAVLKNVVLLEQVLSIGKSNDGKGVRRQGDIEGDKAMTIAELKQEVTKSVEQVLADNQYFDHKFAIVQTQVKEVKEVVKHESDRIMTAVLSGPHDRIVDQVGCLNPRCTL